MSRNGSGVFTVPNTFVSGNPVTAAGHNQNFADIATEMTNSVAADGQTTMTGPLKAASGTVGAPGITFASDPDSGLYRIGSNNLGVGVNGTKIIDVATTGASVTGDVAASGVLKQGGFSLVPIGVVWQYAGTSAPSGFLFCYGQSLVRTDYADLFTAIGTTYGAADGTHFSLPDYRGRVPAGKDDMGGSSANRLTNADDGLNGDTLGATGGGETQTLVTANLPAYTPAGTIATNFPAKNLDAVATGGGHTDINRFSLGNDANTNAGNLNGTSTFTGAAQGGTSTAFGVVQPTIITNYIIFAGV
jgi:microcystin-dependent protein